MGELAGKPFPPLGVILAKAKGRRIGRAEHDYVENVMSAADEEDTCEAPLGRAQALREHLTQELGKVRRENAEVVEHVEQTKIILQHCEEELASLRAALQEAGEAQCVESDMDADCLAEPLLLPTGSVALPPGLASPPSHLVAPPSCFVAHQPDYMAALTSFMAPPPGF